MRYFDLHCDTPYRMYQESLPIDSPLLDCSLPALLSFDRAVQVAAVWSDNKCTPEQNFDRFFRIVEHFRNEVEKHSDVCAVSTDCSFSEKIPVRYILAVEGGDLLCGKLSRLDDLAAAGVRVFAPVWKGINVLGGAHDTDMGLSEFGKDVICRCDELGIIVDVSHMSDHSFADTARITKRFIASHSNARTVCSSGRNLTNEQFDLIVSRGGLVGLNLYPPFVSDSADENSADELFAALCLHALHFSARDGQSALCLGSDRDGIPHADGYTPLFCIPKLYTALCESGIDKTVADAIFYGNAERFFQAC